MSHRVFLRNLIPHVSSRALQKALVDLGLGDGLYRAQIFRPGNSIAAGIANGYLSYDTAVKVENAIAELAGRIIDQVCTAPPAAEVARPRTNAPTVATAPATVAPSAPMTPVGTVGTVPSPMCMPPVGTLPAPMPPVAPVRAVALRRHHRLVHLQVCQDQPCFLLRHQLQFPV